MKKTVWIMTTNDEYELPLALGDTAKELAEIVGTTQDAVRNRAYRERWCGTKSIFHKVDISEE